MSADDGVYILPVYSKYKGQEPHLKKFYVRYDSAIDNLYFDVYDERYKGYNLAMVIEFMMGATVCNSMYTAYTIAERIRNSYSYTEYGICILPSLQLEI
jgi:hypothetical protein